MRLDRAIDLYLGDLARQGKASRTRDDYRRKLLPLCGPKKVIDPPEADEIGPNECRRHLDQWIDSAPGTRYHSWAVLSGFFKWAYRQDIIEANPMARIEPPQRQRAEDLDVVTLSGADVRRMFDACETWHELLCLSTLAYLGPRRTAASNLRRRDVDLERGLIRFREKGGRLISKPIPDEFAGLLRAAMEAGAIGAGPDSYIVPMIRKQRRAGNRDSRILLYTVKRLATRAGIEAAHVHAVRAAFAVEFLETHPGEREALQRILGHTKADTTEIYLRRLNKERAMETVRDLSWGSPFGAFVEEAPSGFEPLYEALQASA
jgi:integrase/recombinase XerD